MRKKGEGNTRHGVKCRHAEEERLIPHYERKPRGYNSLSAKALAEMMRKLGLPPARTVLDLGCGDGRHMEWLARRGARVDGVDYSLRRVLAARCRPALFGAAVVHDDLWTFMEECPCAYELVLMVQTLEHLSDPRAAVDAALPLVAPGGSLFASVPLNAPGPSHLQTFTRESALESLSPDAHLAGPGGGHLFMRWHDRMAHGKETEEAD